MRTPEPPAEARFVLPAVTRYQRDAIFAPPRHAIIEATTKAGKTVGCILWLVHQAMNAGGRVGECWWLAPVYEQTRIAYRRVKAMLKSADPRNSIWSSNDSDLSITLGSGVVLRFKTAEKPDNLYGEDVLAAVIDEASRCREESWIAVRTTLTATGGRIRIIGNVKGRKNWAYRLARRAEAGEMADWRYAKITAHDAVQAGIITKAQVESARRDLPEGAFRELYLAEPSEDGSNPFGLHHIAACVGPLSTEPPVVFGIDLAKSVDWTVVIGLDKHGRVCVFERWQQDAWEVTVQRIQAIVGSRPALADSTGVGDPIVEALQRRAGNIQGLKFTATSKQQLMEGLCLGIQRREVGVLEGVMRAELESFEYEQTRTGVRYSAPEGLHDDCVVALALAYQQYRRYGDAAGPVVSNPGAPPDKPATDCVVAEFNRMRKDIHWGFPRPSRD